MSTKEDTPTSSGILLDAKIIQMTTKENPSLAEGSVRIGVIESELVQFDEPYGWIIVLAVLIIDIHTWGMSAAFGVFLSYYTTNESFQTQNPIVYAYVGGLSISCAFLVSPFVAWLTSRGHGQYIMIAGAFIQSMALIGASFATQIWHLFLTQGVFYGLGIGMLYTGSVGLVSQYFQRHTGLANGITAAGTGIGGLVYSLGTRAMLDNLGYATTLRVLGIVAFVLNGCSVLICRDRNKLVGTLPSRMFDVGLLKEPGFFGLLFYGLFNSLSYVLLLYSISSYTTSIGLTSTQGSIVTATMNAGQIIGRPGIGWLCDRFGQLNMTAAAALFGGVMCLALWTSATTYASLVTFALLVGLVLGTYYAMVAPLTVTTLGIKRLNSALAMVWIMLVVPVTFSEAIASAILKQGGGSYRGVQIFAGCAFLGQMFSIVVLRTRQVSVNDSQEMTGSLSWLSLANVVRWKKV